MPWWGLTVRCPARHHRPSIRLAADDRYLFGMSEFQRAAADLPGAEVTVHSDGALRNQHVSLRPRHHHVPVSDVRPDPHALPEPVASPGTTEALPDEGDAARSGRESRDRRVLHRLRIAVGNEALAGSTADQDFGLAAWRITHMAPLCVKRVAVPAFSV